MELGTEVIVLAILARLAPVIKEEADEIVVITVYTFYF